MTEAPAPHTNGHAAEMRARFDGWENVFQGLGIDTKDPRLATTYGARRNPIDRAVIRNMYSQDPLFANAIDTVPLDATRRWIKITGGDDVADFSPVVLKALAAEHINLRGKCYDLLRLDRLDGGSAMVIGANDKQKPDKELDFERIEELRYLNVLSRTEIMPAEWDTDPGSPTFRQPKFYTTSAPGSTIQKIHASRVIRLTGIATTEEDMLSRSGWGLPYAERVFDAFRRIGTLLDYVEAMFPSMFQGAYSVDQLNQLLSSDEGEGVLLARFRLMHMTKSLFNALILDKSAGESYEVSSTSFAGASDMLLRMMDFLSGSVKIPLSRFFGQAPTGLSTDDKSGEKTYYDGVAAEQVTKFQHPIEYVVRILLASKKGPTAGNVPKQWGVEFLPLLEPSSKETADERLVNAQADKILIDSRQITNIEARTRVAGDPDAPYALESTPPKELTEPPVETQVAQMELKQGAKQPREARTDAFDPSQPRDPRGKWTDGGGGSASSADDVEAARLGGGKLRVRVSEQESAGQLGSQHYASLGDQSGEGHAVEIDAKDVAYLTPETLTRDGPIFLLEQNGIKLRIGDEDAVFEHITTRLENKLLAAEKYGHIARVIASEDEPALERALAAEAAKELPHVVAREAELTAQIETYKNRDLEWEEEYRRDGLIYKRDLAQEKLARQAERIGDRAERAHERVSDRVERRANKVSASDFIVTPAGIDHVAEMLGKRAVYVRGVLGVDKPTLIVTDLYSD